MRWLCLVIGLAVSATGGRGGPPLPVRGDLGRGEKLRILVDKVMQPVDDWVTAPWMIAEAATAGFNVYSPRIGFDDLDAVRRVTDWCAAEGVYHLVWMRGTLVAPAEGERLVWANGVEQELYSPCADAFWAWTERYILEYARLAAEQPALLGVFLDYENYSPNAQGNGYELSYDAAALNRFAAERGATIPTLPPDLRHAWLVEQGLHEAFEQWQVALWRERCRDLRAKVDAICPEFWFVIYPAPGTKFMREACWPEWGTPRAPLVLADANSYGRAAKFLPEPEALAINRQRMIEGEALAEAAGIDYLYAGGIDPVVRGADPEFCGKNAVMLAEQTDGYWIFYEGPTYDDTHRDYLHWFSWANAAIATGWWDAQRAPRETPDGWELELRRADLSGLRLTSPAVTGEAVELPELRLRGENLILLACRAGEPVELTLRHHPLAAYRSFLGWEVRDPSSARIATGRIDFDQTGAVAFKPVQDGIYLLLASAGQCPYSATASNVPVGLWCGDGLGLIGPAPALYGWAGEGGYEVEAVGSGAETVKLTLTGAEGGQSAETTPEQAAVRLTGGAGEFTLACTRAESGVLEDYRLKLSGAAAPVLSLLAEHRFRLAP